MMHDTAKQAKARFLELGWNWDHFHKFTVVRNPWARQLSDHNYRIQVGTNPPSEWHSKNNIKHYEYCVKYAREEPDFRKRVKQGHVVQSQSHWILEDDRPILDTVCRLENLAEDLSKVWTKLALDPADLLDIPHLNRSSTTHYRQEYDHESMMTVLERCRKDIDMFGYSF